MYSAASACPSVCLSVFNVHFKIVQQIYCCPVPPLDLLYYNYFYSSQREGDPNGCISSKPTNQPIAQSNSAEPKMRHYHVPNFTCPTFVAVYTQGIRPGTLSLNGSCRGSRSIPFIIPSQYTRKLFKKGKAISEQKLMLNVTDQMI